MRFFIVINILLSMLIAENYYYQYGKKVVLNPLNEQRVLNGKSIKFYHTSEGKRIALTNDILVKCVNTNTCLNSISKYNLNNVSKLTQQLYVVHLSEADDIFAIAQVLYADENIEFSVPNIIKQREKR